MFRSFLEYAAAMIGCAQTLPPHELEELHAWEAENLGPNRTSGDIGTKDWPGWEKYIGKFQPPPPKVKNTSGYVYLIQSESGHCKIGSARSVASRMRQLQCANPGALMLLHQFSSVNAQQEEFALHGKFAHKRVRNEWFDLTEADIDFIRAAGRSPND